jgi:hypothetical protein
VADKLKSYGVAHQELILVTVHHEMPTITSDFRIINLGKRAWCARH